MKCKLGLGTVQFGLDYGISNKDGKTTEGELVKILKTAREADIDLLDTAFGYGVSEETLGNIGIDGFKVVTKFLPGSDDYSVCRQVELSLKRLRLDHLYGLLAHRPLDVMNNPEAWEYLLTLKADGLVEKIGFSFNSSEEIIRVFQSNFKPDLVQVPYNFLDHRFENYMISLHEIGCEIHTRSTFLQGLFFMKSEELSSFFDEIKPILRNLQTKGRELPGLLLNHTLKMNFVDRVILGVNTNIQLRNNLLSLMSNGSLPYVTIKNLDILIPSKWPKD